MSLYNELRPEIKELLEADREEYPNLVESIVKALEKWDGPWASEISVNVASQLLRYLEQKIRFSVNEFFFKCAFVHHCSIPGVSYRA